MKNLKVLLFTLAVGVVISLQSGYAQGSLIWSQTFNDGGNGPTNLVQAEFWFGLGATTNRGDVATQFLFDQVVLGTNDVGDTFTIASAADDPDFAAVVNALTNGIDQSFQYTIGLRGLGGTAGPPESQIFDGTGVGPDLIGYQIQSFSLYVDNLTFQNPGPYNEQVTLSIYGIPVPEPEPALMILLGSGVLLYARRFHKQH